MNKSELIKASMVSMTDINRGLGIVRRLAGSAGRGSSGKSSFNLLDFNPRAVKSVPTPNNSLPEGFTQILPSRSSQIASARKNADFLLGPKSTAAPQVAESPGMFSRLGEFMKRPGVAPTAAGVGAGTGGYLLGSGLGESRGREAGQVMGSYEGYKQAMQEAQQRYNDQGIIDRILGNNPF
jgi:hypothetical protein